MKHMNFSNKWISIISLLIKNNITDFETAYGYTKQIKINKSIRQGCVLAPTCYLISQAPLHHSLNKISGYKINNINTSTISFADDLLLISNNQNNIKKMLQTIEKFDLATGQILSPSKTIYTNNKNENLNLRYKDKPIKFQNKEEYFKFLGIFFNLDLSWIKTQQFLEDKIKLLILTLNKKNYLNTDSLILFINQVIISFLSYRFNVILFNYKWLKKINSKLIKCICKNSRIWFTSNQNLWYKFRNCIFLPIQNIKNYLITFQKIGENNFPISNILKEKNFKNNSKNNKIKIFKYNKTSGIPKIEKLTDSLNLKIFKSKKNSNNFPSISLPSNLKSIDIFTDGSLKKNDEIIIKKSSIYIDDSYNLTFTPLCSNSSFGTELSSILCALLSSSNIENVTIYTDSYSSIQAINNFNNYNNSRILKMEDRFLLRRIIQQINSKKIKPNFNFIHSHLDETNDSKKINKMKEIYGEKLDKIISKNSIVDKLNNRNTSIQVINDINEIGNDSITFTSNNSINYIPLKIYIPQILNNLLWNNFIFNNKLKTNQIYQSNNQINWKYSTLIFKSKINHQIKNFLQKLWTKNLNTNNKMIGIINNTKDNKFKEILKKTYSNINCPLCNQIDSFDHFTSSCLFTIDTNLKTFREIQNIFEENEINIKPWFTINNNNFQHYSNFNNNLGNIGLIPSSLIEELKINKLNSNLIKNLIIQSQEILISNLINLWNKRFSQ